MVCAGQHPRTFYYTIAPKNIGSIQLILYFCPMDGINKKETYVSEHLQDEYLAVKYILKGCDNDKTR